MKKPLKLKFLDKKKLEPNKNNKPKDISKSKLKLKFIDKRDLEKKTEPKKIKLKFIDKRDLEKSSITKEKIITKRKIVPTKGKYSIKEYKEMISKINNMHNDTIKIINNLFIEIQKSKRIKDLIIKNKFKNLKALYRQIKIFNLNNLQTLSEKETILLYNKILKQARFSAKFERTAKSFLKTL